MGQFDMFDKPRGTDTGGPSSTPPKKISRRAGRLLSEYRASRLRPKNVSEPEPRRSDFGAQISTAPSTGPDLEEQAISRQLRPHAVIPSAPLLGMTGSKEAADEDNREIDDSDVTVGRKVEENPAEREQREKDESLTKSGLADVLSEKRSKGKRGTGVKTGDTLSKRNRVSKFNPKSSITHHEIEEVKPEPVPHEEDMDKFSDEEWNRRVKLAPLMGPSSTTVEMRQPEGPAEQIATPVRESGSIVTPTKPEPRKVNGVVIPLGKDSILDTTREGWESPVKPSNRTAGGTRTGVADANKTSARPTRGRTPERKVVLEKIQQQRAQQLAEEKRGPGATPSIKDFTTHSDAVIATAKNIGLKHYGLNSEYMNSPRFLHHEAVTKAAVMHASGTQDDISKLHNYLGGNPLEATARLHAAYDIYDKASRNAHPNAGAEADLLTSMIQTGNTISKTRRAVEKGVSSDVTVRGEALPTRPVKKAPKKASDSVSSRGRSAEVAGTFIPASGGNFPPDARTGEVQVTKPGEKPVTRPLTEAERSQKNIIPTKDDSKNRF